MSGVTYDYMEEYIRGLIPESEGKLKELEDFAKENGVPIAQKETIKFLEFMVSMKKPLRILELGTVIAFALLASFKVSAISFTDIPFSNVWLPGTTSKFSPVNFAYIFIINGLFILFSLFNFETIL